jgi:hypothetical protein
MLDDGRIGREESDKSGTNAQNRTTGRRLNESSTVARLCHFGIPSRYEGRLGSRRDLKGGGAEELRKGQPNWTFSFEGKVGEYSGCDISGTHVGFENFRKTPTQYRLILW